MRAFVLVPVFDVSQTEGPPLPEPPPVAALTGDSHAHLLAGLVRGASEAGYAVERREEMPGRAQGFVDQERRLIALSSALEPNGQVAVLAHELAHGHGARYQDFGRAGAEVVAETAAFIACRARASTRRAKRCPTYRDGQMRRRKNWLSTRRPFIGSPRTWSAASAVAMVWSSL